ncbi:MAG TPA: cytochrome c biogenesis protein CcsA, partial [Mycobacteriales bacterium]|nr:cytochrome c biogenesis protein CcsA [Mycobacteriales bacterium]
MPPDLHLAHTSDTLLFLAVVCYALAMLGYAGEFAFRHRSAGPAANASGATALRGGLADRLGAAGVAATVLGWVAHVGSVTTRGLAVHRVPWGNMYEFSSMVALIAVTAFLVLLSRQDVRYLGAFLMVPVVTYLGLAGTVLYSAPAPLVPALHSYWIKIHVVAAISASGVFMLAGVVTVLFLVKDRWERGGPPLATVLLRGLGRMVPGGRRSGAVSLGPGTAAAVELGTGGGGGIMRALPS